MASGVHGAKSAKRLFHQQCYFASASMDGSENKQSWNEEISQS
jgi:hypothetical protein